jgi:C-terminal processing protease CtpA/Prc
MPTWDQIELTRLTMVWKWASVGAVVNFRQIDSSAGRSMATPEGSSSAFTMPEIQRRFRRVSPVRLFLILVLITAPLQAAGRLFTPNELQADFTALYSGLQAAHYDLYAFTPKAALDKSYQRTLAGLDRPMTLLEAETRFQLFTAQVHMGHTRVEGQRAAYRQYRADGGTAFPIDLRIASARVYVAANASGLAAISIGDEILEMNGKPMARWIARVERHVSAESAYMAGSLLEYDFALYLWVELGPAQEFALLLRKPGGARMQVKVPARTRIEMKSFAAAQPPALSLEEPLREAKLLAGNVAYLRPGPFYNTEAKTGADEWNVESFRSFIDDAFRKFEAAGAKELIVDLRGNPGGDSLFSDVMVSWFADKPFRFFSQFKVRVSSQSTAANRDRIAHDAEAAGPVSRQYAELYSKSRDGELIDFEAAYAQPRKDGRFTGKVFALVDRQSYSNAVAVAATIQDYKFGTVIGEPTADMATTYGAMEQFALPNTGIMVGYPKARIVRPNADLRSRGVTPDRKLTVPIVQTPADEVLQQALALIRP